MLHRQVGSYRITEKLAQGGMGEVYVAQHELMDREAVVKVLHPKLSHDEEVVHRFLNEARAAASIEHPGIVAIYDLGRADGQVYIVMERLRGETLAERIARAPISVEQAMAMSRQLASALGAAHARDIVHRDLKPENIFVVADPDVPGGERIKVLDFGVAKLAPSVGGSNLTAQGSIFGTPAYMAPEQCEDAATVDPRTDLYAIGCIMYEMLCGQPPFGKGGLELLAAHLRDEPPPPSQHNPGIPANLEATILRLLAKKPAERLASCDELIRALGGATVEPPAPRRSSPQRVPSLAFAATVAPESVPPGHAYPRTGTLPLPTEPPESTTAASMATPMATIAPSPTTFRSASGQVNDTMAMPRRRRTIKRLAVALVLASTGAAAAVLVSRDAAPGHAPAAQPSVSAPPVPTEPAEPAPWQADLDLADSALLDMRWDEAVVAAGRVLELAPDGADAHERARDIQDKARQGQRYAFTYESFLAAVKEEDIRTAVYAYEQLPDDSMHRMKATPAYDALRDAWLAPRLQAAGKHVSDGRCSRIEPVAQEVGFLFPESVDAIRDLHEDCRNRRKSDARKAKQSPAKDTPDDAAAEDESAPASPDDAEAAEEQALPEKVADEDIQQRMTRLRRRLAQCHQSAGLSEPVTLSFRIMPRGRVRRVSSGTGVEAFDRCAWDVLRAVAFPPAQGVTEVSYPVGQDDAKKPAPRRPARPVRR